jgi:hypothetical protein
MKRKITAKQYIGGGLAALALFGGVKAAAIEREGVVTQKRYDGEILEIFIKTDANNLGADNIITIPDIYSITGTAIDEFTERGTVVRFK